MALCRPRPSLSRPYSVVVRAQSREQQRRQCPRREALQGRRPFLLSLGCLISAPSLTASAEEKSQNQTLAGTEDRPKALRSAAGFDFVYPSSWLVAFERGETSKEGVIAFVGNFLTVDTFSVEKIRPIATDSRDPQGVAKDTVRPVQQSPASISFHLIDSSYKDTKQGSGSVYVVEYDVNTCKGLVSEGLGGKKLCKDTKDNDLQTVPRHHLVGVTRTEDAVYILRASCPSPRWQSVKADLWMTMNSFVAHKSKTEKPE